MLKGLTYRKKNRLLAIGAVVLLLLTYLLSVSRTVDAYREVSGLEKRSEEAKNAPSKVSELERELKGIEKLFGTNQEGHVQQELLETVTGYCKTANTVLREFPRTVYHEEKDLVVETNVFTVEGSFRQLLKITYLLEEEKKLGRISSVRYFTKKDPKTKVPALNATIYLQNINKTDHEK